MTNFFSDSYNFIVTNPFSAAIVLAAILLAAWAICRDKEGVDKDPYNDMY